MFDENERKNSRSPEYRYIDRKLKFLSVIMLTVPKDAMYSDVQQGINDGYQVDKDEQVLEDKLQKYQEYKMGSLDQMGSCDDKTWY